MRSTTQRIALALVLVGCGGSGYGSVDDVISETSAAVVGRSVVERWDVDCLEGDDRTREAASVEFPEVTDIPAALDDIEATWSALWPEATRRESEGRVVVSTPPGAVAATVTNDPEGELRVDLVGPCVAS